MAEGYKPPRNWGCLIAFVIGLPLLCVAMISAVLDGGRCEGMGPDCRPGGPDPRLVFLAIVIGSFALAWGLNTLINRSPRNQESQASHVARTIRAFLDGTCGEHDWDDFTSHPLRDRRLDSIRLRAGAVPLPAGEEERGMLLALAEEAETLRPANDRTLQE